MKSEREGMITEGQPELKTKARNRTAEQGFEREGCGSCYHSGAFKERSLNFMQE